MWDATYTKTRAGVIFLLEVDSTEIKNHRYWLWALEDLEITSSNLLILHCRPFKEIYFSELSVIPSRFLQSVVFHIANYHSPLN